MQVRSVGRVFESKFLLSFKLSGRSWSGVYSLLAVGACNSENHVQMFAILTHDLHDVVWAGLLGNHIVVKDQLG